MYSLRLDKYMLNILQNEQQIILILINDPIKYS